MRQFSGFTLKNCLDALSIIIEQVSDQGLLVRFEHLDRIVGPNVGRNLDGLTGPAHGPIKNSVNVGARDWRTTFIDPVGCRTY